MFHHIIHCIYWKTDMEKEIWKVRSRYIGEIWRHIQNRCKWRQVVCGICFIKQ